MRGDLARAFALRILGVLAGSGVSKALLIAFEVAVVSLQGREFYGVYAVLLTLFTFTTMLGALGIPNYMMRELARLQEGEDPAALAAAVDGAVVFAAGAGLLAGGAIFAARAPLAARLLQDPAYAPLVGLVAVAVAFGTLNAVLAAVFSAFRRVWYFLLAGDSLRNAAVFATLLTLRDPGQRPGFVVAVFVGATAVTSLLSLAALARLRRERGVPPLALAGRAAAVRDLVAGSLDLSLLHVCQVAARHSTVLVVAGLFTSDEAGVLNLLLRASLPLTFIQSSLNQVAPVEYARLHAIGDVAGLRDLYLRICQGLTLGAALWAVPLSLEGPAALGWIDPGLARYAPHLAVIVLAQAVNVGTGPVAVLMISCRRGGLLLAVTVVDSALNLGLLFGLARAYGLEGAVAAKALGTLGFTALRNLASQASLGVSCFSWRLVGPGLAAGAAGLAARAAAPWLPAPLPGSGAGSAAFALIAAGAAGTLGPRLRTRVRPAG